MPNAFVCPRHETLAWLEYADTPPEEAQVRVRCEFGAEKHGTMMSFFKGHGNQRGTWDGAAGVFRPGRGVVWDYPIPLGNMAVGRIEAVGPVVQRRRVGERVLCFGGFRPTVTTHESQCWPIPDAVPWQTAVCLDPASFALSAVRDGGVRVGDAVAVFSLGAIGLMCVQMARLAGAHPIIAIDPFAGRREVALGTGADLALDPSGGADVGLAIREATGGRGADVVIEYSGMMEAMQGALRGVAFGGNVVAGAFPSPHKAGLDLGAEAHMNRPNIIFSRTESDPDRDHPRWSNARNRELCHHLICSGKLDGVPLVQPVIPFEALMERYLELVTNPALSIKLGVRY